MRTDLVLRSWLRTRMAMRCSPGALARLRAQQWRALAPALARTPGLAAWAGQGLAAFPIVSPAQLRTDYGCWNSLGLGHGDLVALADVAEAAPATGDLTAGWSSGTGEGPRGLFVATGAERADYIGQSLARLLPPAALLRRQRLALHLRASNALYTDAGGRRMAFAHVPLNQDVAATRAALESFAPTILIAPAHRLLALAQAGLALPSLAFLFHGSEPMSTGERRMLTAHFGLVPRAIWQATEGFLAAECTHGRLHLNDHALEIELEPIPGTPAFGPVVTDLRRRSQPVVRLRLDDVIELDQRGPCRCGYAGRTIRAPQGRIGDVWHLPGGTVLPRQVVDAVEGAIQAGVQWQAILQAGTVLLRTAPGCPADQATAATRALKALAGPLPITWQADLPPWPGPKRRKVVGGNG